MTTWDMLYTAEQMPDQVQIAAYMDNPLWEQFSRWIETTYQCQPVMQYSKCSLKRGWNIKYRKGSRAICTVYPESGSFYLFGQYRQQAIAGSRSVYRNVFCSAAAIISGNGFV